MKKAIILIFSATLFLAGCNMAGDMTPKGLTVTKKQPFSVKVEPTLSIDKNGDIDTDKYVKTSNSWVTDALVKALSQSETFETVVASGDSDFTVQVTQKSISYPVYAVKSNCTYTAQWVLKNVKTKKVVWQNTIETTHNLAPLAAMLPEVSNHQAYTGAVRENIKEGIKQLSMLEL